jgi:hypothetical protein
VFLSYWNSSEPTALREAFGLTTIGEALARDRARLNLLVEVSRLFVHAGGRGNTAFITFADESGTLGNVTLFSAAWNKWKEKLRPGKIARVCLERKESRDAKYGKWTYFLDDRGALAPVESLLELRRRVASAIPAGAPESV